MLYALTASGRHCTCVTFYSTVDLTSDNFSVSFSHFLLIGHDDYDDDVELHVLGCRLTYQGQTVTNAEAWFDVALRPQKPSGSLGRPPRLSHFS